MSSSGWYPDPSGASLQRYWDGAEWTEHTAPLPYETARVVQGPNHALHLVLTLLTFWACGGWAWIWLLIAISDKKRIRYVT